MAYNLGPVQPKVRAAVERLGPMFGFTVVHGWRASDPVSSDHPDGWAADFMTRSKAQGDTFTAYLVLNAEAEGIDYIIWWRRSWNSKRKTWVAYTRANGDPNVDHTNHAHVTWLRTNTVSASPISNPFSAYTETLDKLETLFVMLTDKGTWIRTGLVLSGIVFVAIGVMGASRVQSIAMKAVQR